MGQNANAVLAGQKPSGALGTLKTDASGNTITTPGGFSRTLNITAATVVKASAGMVGVVTVAVAGSAAGAIHDIDTTGAAAAANKIYTTPAAVGSFVLNFPCDTGIVVAPGTGQTIVLSWK